MYVAMVAVAKPLYAKNSIIQEFKNSNGVIDIIIIDINMIIKAEGQKQVKFIVVGKL